MRDSSEVVPDGAGGASSQQNFQNDGSLADSEQERGDEQDE